MPTKKDSSISIAKSGMNKDSHISNLKETEFRHAKNSNFWEEGGEGYNIQNEHSNLITSKFKPGFKVIGYLTEVNIKTTYFFLKNPSTGVSEIGNIFNNKNQTEDTYQTILKDDCNGCLNFNIDYPIKTSVFKNEKCGKILYWTDNYNTPRYLELDNIDQYKFKGEILCGEDNREETCIDCNKLKIFKDSIVPALEPTEIVLGGNLKRGVYQATIAYCDEAGNEQSRYFTVTEPVSIFDNQNIILEQSELADETNYALKFKVSNLDKRFTHYKVVIVQNADISKATSYIEEGVHSTSDNTILYTTDQNKQRTSLDKIIQFAVRVDKLEKLATANNYLLGKGITYKKRSNLQKVVNLIGAFVQWQSHIATENLYKDGVNASKYRQFTRDETYPLALRFIEDGEYSPTFPLIGRRAQDFDLQTINNRDSQSINKNGSTCSSEQLDKRWQLYNTAKELGRFPEVEDIEYTTVPVTERESCLIDNVAEINQSSVTISLEEGDVFVDLANYIEDNIEDILGTPDQNLSSGLLAIKNIFTLSNYTNVICTPEFDKPDEDFCSNNITLLDEEIELLEIESESQKFIPSSFPDEYPSLRSPEYCNSLEPLDSDGSNTYWGGGRDGYCDDMRSSGFPDRNCNDLFTTEFPYETDPSFFQEIGATDDLRTVSNSFFVNYYFSLEKAELLTLKNATPTRTDKTLNSGRLVSEWYPAFQNTNDEVGYDNFLYKNARWYNINVPEDDKFVFYMSRESTPDVGIMNTREYRINVYTSTSNSIAPIFTTLKEIRQQLRIKFEKKENGSLDIIDSDGTVYSNIPDGAKNTYYISIDTPFQFMSQINIEPAASKFELPEQVNGETVYSAPRFLNFSSPGCYNVAVLKEINKAVEIDYQGLKVGKRQTYEADCEYQEPIISDDCKAIPYAFGSMAYTESTEEYPDNKGLYDSTDLNISPEDIPSNIFYKDSGVNISFRDYFENNFTQGVENGKYVLSENLDYRCKNIRHFKFPDNKVSNHTYDITLPNYSNSFVFPLGIKLDGRIVSSFLDIAVKNKLITQDQRDLIQGFELLRGDRSAEKSIIAKGITFDLYEYQKESRNISYANFPLNSLGDDIMHYSTPNRNQFIPHPYNSNGNTKWTFTSPETDYNQINIPSIMKVEGYAFGSTVGNIDLVEDHAKWTILGRRLQNTASTLATVEVVAEAVIESMQSFSNYNQQAGFTNTVFAGAFVATPIIAAFNTITAAIFKYARYKYEWLEIFRNLGKRRNFAAYYTTVGKFNRLETLQEEGDSLRFLNIRDNISSGRSIFTDNIAGERIELNHVDREKTVLLSVGSDSFLEYPDNYKINDNTTLAASRSSKTFASQAGACANGLSRDIERNTSAMYVSLKNFLPSQYGTIGSVKWIPVNQRGDLTRNNLFFGGDTFICRHTLRRPFSFFLSTAFDQADMTPYEYKFYTNIGEEPRFFVNFQTDSEEREGGRVLPFKNSEYEMDCLDNRGSYIKEPSKFYLYNNGIPSFLTESTINTNYRYAGPEPWKNFYPNEADYMRWTQQKENPIRRGNTFLYNNEYSLQTLPTGVLTFPDTYNQKEYDCKTDAPNGIIYSLPDNSENNFIDPWLIFRPNDKYEFPTKYGKLNSIKGIESEQVITIFDNTTAIFNAVDQLVDDGQNPQARETGLGGIFARRPRVFTETSLGYAGSQNYPLLSCEYGHFFTDTDRGHIFKIPPGGKGIEEISSVSNGEPTGMENWFKENLPFKIKEYFPDVDIDNPFNGFGIAMGYDSRYKRIFLTKKDYIPTEDVDICVNSEGVLYNNSSEEVIKQEYEQQGFSFKRKVDCKLEFDKTVEALRPGTTIFAVQDGSGSFSEENQQAISQVLDSFVENFNSNLEEGEQEVILKKYTIQNERWLSYTDLVDNYFGDSPTNNEDIIIITFCNEAFSSYHGFRLDVDQFNYTEPRVNKYLEDYNNFVEFQSKFNSFKGIAYPILVDFQDYLTQGKILLQQTLFALFGNNATQEEVDNLQRNSAFTDEEWSNLKTQLKEQNPYNVLGLDSYGWSVQTNLNNLNGEIINFERFSSDILTLLQQGQTTTEEIIQVPLERANLSEFKDVSWTISYYLKTGKWTSFFDFKPNYYINHNDYFQTGINSDDEEFGLWSHLLTNKSFQEFYGKKYKWEIEIPVQNKGNNRALESISYQLDSRKYLNERDYIQNKELGFNETYVYSNSNISGKLKLNLQKTLRDLSKYPITEDGFQEILQTQQDGIMRFNYIYNRVNNEFAGIPLFIADENGVDKEINENVASFVGKSVLERMRSDTFIVNLSSSETEHKKIFKLAQFNSNLYNK